MSRAEPNPSVVGFFPSSIVVGHTHQKPYVGYFDISSFPSPRHIIEERMGKISTGKDYFAPRQERFLIRAEEHLFWRSSERVFSPGIHRERENLSNLCASTEGGIGAEVFKYHRSFQMDANQRRSRRSKFYGTKSEIIHSHPWTMFGFPLRFSEFVTGAHRFQLSVERYQRAEGENRQDNSGTDTNSFQPYPLRFSAFFYAATSIFGFVIFSYFYGKDCSKISVFFFFLGLLVFAYGFGKFVQVILEIDDQLDKGTGTLFHGKDTVPQKYLLTTCNYWGTVIGIGRMEMPNVLPMEKQVAVISALAEGSGIRQIERMTGVHRDTIMRLGVRVGKGCQSLLDAKMRDLPCQQLQFDEIWGFIGKKERHLKPEDNPEYGDVWTFCAIDPDTKLVPSFKVGKRDLATADAFVADVASRLRNRVQISSDALRAYVDAIEMNFGANVDFAQIVKTYITDDSHIPERRFSAPEIVVTEKKRITGFPNMHRASTSHVERLNGTTRLHMRRLTRLTYAFSKKLENFEAAVALHFAYYNFVKRHNTLRTTPAMAAGAERDFWTVRDLVEAA